MCQVCLLGRVQIQARLLWQPCPMPRMHLRHMTQWNCAFKFQQLCFSRLCCTLVVVQRCGHHAGSRIDNLWYSDKRSSNHCFTYSSNMFTCRVGMLVGLSVPFGWIRLALPLHLKRPTLKCETLCTRRHTTHSANVTVEHMIPTYLF
jgi:hypothetical protein